MSFAIRPTNCERCGKSLSMFEGRYCLECQKEIDKEFEVYEGNTGVFDEPYPWKPDDIIGILKHIIEVADTNSCGVKEIDGIDEEAINNAITIIGSFEQIKWERDTAIAQLKELGYEFGEKIETIDGKPVTGIRKYRKEARRWKRKYIRVNNQLSKSRSVIENIKTEIKGECTFDNPKCDINNVAGLVRALEIIDKHIGGVMQMQLLIKTYQTEADIQEELNEAIRYAKRKGLIPTTDDEWEELKETADADSD